MPNQKKPKIMNLEANESIQIGNIILSVGRETNFVALISPFTNEFIKLDKSKSNKILKKVKRNLKTCLNSDETFTFEFMTPETTNQLIDILRNKKPIKKQPEVVKVERGRMLDTDNQALNVKIKFGQFEMDFEWTLNTRTNWVHTDDNPTRLDGIKIDGESFQIEKSANTIMFDFNFDETKIGEEIEDRKHIII